MGDVSHLNGRDDSGPRRICIIGSGLSGVGYLNGLLDLPAEARAGWEIDMYEHRLEAGGVWVPQSHPPEPPVLPETPVYNDLECIALSNGMTFPNRPLPPSSLLFSKEKTIHRYIQDHIRDFDLAKYIRLGHTVVNAALDVSKDNRYPWTVTVERRGPDGSKETISKTFTTLIVGNGVTPTPRRLSLPGESDWLSNGSNREIMHSMWYREPSIGRGRTVIVIGSHPSGNHVARAMCDVAREVHHIFVPDMSSGFLNAPSASNYTHHSSRLVQYSANELVLSDGNRIVTPEDALVVECSGYWRDHPFLPESVLRRIKGEAFDYDSLDLTSNDRYTRPLHKAIMPIDPSIPAGSMAFACLFPVIWNLPTSYAQGIWFAHLLADLDKNNGKSAILPSPEAALEEIKGLEAKQRGMGHDMARRGYFLVPPGIATDNYADQLIREIRQHSSHALPAYLAKDPKQEYTEPWRRRAFSITLGLCKAWDAAKDEGIEASFSQGAKTEEDFAQAVEKLVAWWEEKSGLKVGMKGP